MKCQKCGTVNPPDSKFCKECATPLPPSGEISVLRTKTALPPGEDLTTGTVFAGRYQVIEELGHGGMGKVYKAFDKETNSKVALKLIRPEVAADKNAIERFRNELKTARDISHKHICRMYDLGREADRYFITMEYVSGEDVRSLIRETKRLDIGTAISIAKQICEGLAEAHRVGVVHRDLKPSNIMIDREGEAKIMDFGIARSLRTKGITGPGAAVGTPEYMSPEQVEGKDADQRSDIYSLSIILYEMVTGTVPFEGETASDIGRKHKSELPENPKKLNPQVPDDLSRLILKGLEMDKAKRYQTAEEVLSELSRIEQKLPTTEKVIPKRKPITSREITVKFSLRKLRIPGLVLAAIAVLVILALFFMKRQPSVPSTMASQKQLTFSGNASYPAVAPDGRFFAYATSETFDEQAVLVQDMISGQSLELLRAKECRRLSWTPDGSELSFWAELKDASSGIFVLPRLGGTPRKIAAARLFAWSPDGTQFASCDSNSKAVRISSRTSGESTTIPFKGALGTIAGIDWSSKSSHLLFYSEYESHRSAIWTISLDGKEQHKVLEGDLYAPKWSMRECAIYCERYKPPALFEIIKISISPRTGEPTKPPSIIVSQSQGTFRDFTVTSDGQKLLYAQEASCSNLWQGTVRGPGQAPSGDIKQVTKGTFYDLCPSISPDGKTIAFSRGFGDNINIYVMPVEGGSPQQITFINSLNFSPAWSPDGKEIAFISNQGGAAGLWKVSAVGGNPYQFKENKLVDVAAKLAWAPGRRILYPAPDRFAVLDPETGRATAFFKDESGTEISDAAYSSDGNKVAVLRTQPPDHDSLWVFSFRDSSKMLLRKGTLFPIGWSADGRWVYASEYLLGTVKILMIDLETKEAKTVASFPFNLEKGRPYNFQVTMTPDARRFVFPVLKMQSDVWVIENFDQTMR